MSASVLLTYQGPFTPANLYAAADGKQIIFTHAAPSAVVLAATASQIAVSDPGWYRFA
jgi:hypothetical protein